MIWDPAVLSPLSKTIRLLHGVKKNGGREEETTTKSEEKKNAGFLPYWGDSTASSFRGSLSLSFPEI